MSGSFAPCCSNRPRIRHPITRPVNRALSASQLSATESAVHSSTAISIPRAPCDGESSVHRVSPASDSENRSNNGNFVRPRSSSPRHAPFSPYASPHPAAITTAATITLSASPFGIIPLIPDVFDIRTFSITPLNPKAFDTLSINTFRFKAFGITPFSADPFSTNPFCINVFTPSHIFAITPPFILSSVYRLFSLVIPPRVHSHCAYKSNKTLAKFTPYFSHLFYRPSFLLIFSPLHRLQKSPYKKHAKNLHVSKKVPTFA